MIRDINRIHNMICEQQDIAFSEYELSIKQWELLKCIYEYESNVINANDIVKEVKKDKRLISINISKLEQKGYILRVDNELDKRVKYISLTEQGLNVAQDLAYIEEEIYEQLTANIPHEELLILEKSLALINDNIFDNRL